MHYYKTCIEPVMSMDFELLDLVITDVEKKVLDNYSKFIETLLNIFQRRRKHDKRCNVFTTNYDGCFVYTADRLLENGNVDFVINDGARGFS